MLSLYTGTPGSGKSYHATERIDVCLKRGMNVIANYKIKTNYKHKGIFVFKKTLDLTVDFLIDFAREHHVPKKESQTFVVIDEAHIKFNTRGFDIKERIKWLEFLACSRHLGFDILLITQNDRAIDRQVRGLIEYNFKHRKLSGFGAKGMLLVVLLHKRFVSVKYWYVLDEKCEASFFNIKKKVADLYDTFAAFTEKKEELKKDDDKLPNVSEFNKKRGIS